MARTVKVLALMLVIPVLAATVAAGLRKYLEADFRNSVVKLAAERGIAPEDPRVAALTLASICGSEQPPPGCRVHRVLGGMVVAAAAVSVAGLALMTVIAWAGRGARGDRARLVRVFGPLLKVTMISATGILLVQGVLAVGSIYLLETLLFQRVHLVFLGAMALAVAVAVWRMIRAAVSTVREASATVLGEPLEPRQSPRLRQLVEETAARVGTAAPDTIVLGLDPNFFVTEVPVQCPDARLTGRTLFVSLPLCRILTTDELRGVVAHEMGHFKGQDTEYTRRFAPIYRGASESLAAVASSVRSLSGLIALAPTFYLLGYFLESFAVAETEIGRGRELAADQVAAQASGERVFAAALVKIHAYARRWEWVQSWINDAVAEGRPFENVTSVFLRAVADTTQGDPLAGLLDEHLRHPTDSHPPLGDRLASLQIPMNQVASRACEVTPADSAALLIDDPEPIEKRLSAALQQVVRQLQELQQAAVA